MTDVNKEWQALMDAMDVQPEYYVLRVRKDDLWLWSMYLLGVLVGLSLTRRT